MNEEPEEPEDLEDPKEPEFPAQSWSKQIIALLEVICVRFIIYGGIAYFIISFIETTPPIDNPIDNQKIILLQYLVGLLWFLIPTVIILLFGRSLKEYGWDTSNFKISVHVGFRAFLCLLFTNLGYLLLLVFGLSYLAGWGSLLLSGTFILAFLFIFIFSKKKKSNDEREKANAEFRNYLIVIPLLLALPMVLSLIFGQYSNILLLTVIWQFIFSGFGEEFFFRGYIQTRLNVAFGKPYRFKNISFGPAIFITAFIFAITHVLNTFSIFTWEGTPSWWWGLFTFIGGIIFGLLREQTNNIYACGLAHGMEAVGEGIGFLL